MVRFLIAFTSVCMQQRAVILLWFLIIHYTFPHYACKAAQQQIFTKYFWLSRPVSTYQRLSCGFQSKDKIFCLRQRPKLNPYWWCSCLANKFQLSASGICRTSFLVTPVIHYVPRVSSCKKMWKYRDRCWSLRFIAYPICHQKTWWWFNTFPLAASIGIQSYIIYIEGQQNSTENPTGSSLEASELNHAHSLPLWVVIILLNLFKSYHMLIHVGISKKVLLTK